MVKVMFQPKATPFAAFPPHSPSSSYNPFFDLAFPNAFTDSKPQIFNSVPSSSALQSQTHYQTSLRFASQQERSYNMDHGGAHSMEAQEALAREFQPALEGPLVGSKQDSNVITEEYAKADPIYVAKTMALPSMYSHYRPILGDGNCGWRAVAFAYFETMIRIGDRNRLAEEVARMTSFNNFLRTAGGYSDLVTDMADEAIDLLRAISAAMTDAPGAADLLLAQRFADANVGSYIIAHFRYLAASWLKKYPDDYQGFIADIGIEEYCKTTLEPSNEEIDHVGMKLLIDVLLRPIGISVVIAHLDRSAGSEVNHHQFPADESIGLHEPIIYLLFRPTHYDILYKDPPPLPQQQRPAGINIQVNRAAFHQRPAQRNIDGFSNLDLSVLVGIPALDLAPQAFNPTYGSQMDQPYASSSSISPISPSSSMTAFHSPTSQIAPGFPSQPATSPGLVSPTVMSPRTAFSSSSLELPIEHLPEDRRGSISSLPITGRTFRPSKYEWEAAADWQEPPAPTFTTSTFKNSHYNTAHFQNPHFHPEEWTPDMDETINTSQRKKSH